jgi:hypothetical protein
VTRPWFQVSGRFFAQCDCAPLSSIIRRGVVVLLSLLVAALSSYDLILPPRHATGNGSEDQQPVRGEQEWRRFFPHREETVTTCKLQVKLHLPTMEHV